MNKEQQAIARLQLAAEMSETYYHAPLVITTSGGKDSDVCLTLARAAGIRYEVQASIIILRLTRRKPFTMCAKLSVGWKTRVSSVLSTCRHTRVLA